MNIPKEMLFTWKWEYGYSNNPNDKGLETLNGISRRSFPDWDGWKGVDELKKSSVSIFDLRKAVRTTEIDNLTFQFYKEYWKNHRVDDIKNPYLQAAYFDTAFMSREAVRLLQRSIVFMAHYAINRVKLDGVDYKNLEKWCDNDFGKLTKRALDSLHILGWQNDIADILIYKRTAYQSLLGSAVAFDRGWSNRDAHLGLYLKSGFNESQIGK